MTEDEQKELTDLAARLDRLWLSIEKGASWESAGHLRNRSIYAIQAIARDLGRMARPPVVKEP